MISQSSWNFSPYNSRKHKTLLNPRDYSPIDPLMKHKIYSNVVCCNATALEEARHANMFSSPDALFPPALGMLKVLGVYKARLSCVTCHMGSVGTA